MKRVTRMLLMVWFGFGIVAFFVGLAVGRLILSLLESLL